MYEYYIHNCWSSVNKLSFWKITYFCNNCFLWHVETTYVKHVMQYLIYVYLHINLYMPSGNWRPYGLDLNVSSHAVKIHVCTSRNSMIEGKPRCAALTCLCTIPFVYNASAYTEKSPVSLLLHLKLIEAGRYVAVLLASYGVSNKVALYCCMRRHSVSALAGMMACCLFCSRPSSDSMMVYR